MSEEEIIDIIEEILQDPFIYFSQDSSYDSIQIRANAIKNLLDLYNKEKENNKKYRKALLYVVNQFAYDEKRAEEKNELLYTGGLGTLEEVFNVLDIDEGIRRKDIWRMIQELLEDEDDS